MRKIVPAVAIALALLFWAVPASASVDPPPAPAPGINLDGLGGVIANAFRQMWDSWWENAPPSQVGSFLLRGIGWIANQQLAGQIDVAEDSGGFLIELNRAWITENSGVRAGYVVFSGLIGGWIAIHAMWNGFKCMIAVGDSAAMGETIQAVGPGIIIPVFLAANGLAIADWLIQFVNLVARAFFGGAAATVAETLRAAEAAGVQTDANLAMGGYILATAVSFVILGLSRLAVHGVAAMCVITLVPAVLSMANPSTQWIFATWRVFAAGSLLGHVLQAAMLRAGGGMVADAFSGAQGAPGNPNQIMATMAAISTMMMAASIPAAVGLGVAAHSFGVGRLIGRVIGKKIPQSTDAIEVPNPEQSQAPREEVYEVRREDVVITRMSPVRPAARISTSHSYDGPPTHQSAMLPPPREEEE